MAETAAAKKPRAVSAHPKTLDMVVEAIKTIKDTKGSSVQAIKAFILSHYPTVSPSHLTANLRRALKAGLDSGLLVRPKGSTATGATGRLRVGKLPEKPKKKPAKKKTPMKKKPVKKPKEKKTPKKAKAAKKPSKSSDAEKKKVAKKPKKTPTKSSTKKTEKKKTDKAKQSKKAVKKTPAKKTGGKVSKPKKPKAKTVAKKK